MENTFNLKKLAVRILLACVFAFGIWALIYSYVQPTVTATITSLGPVTSRHHRTRRGRSSYTTYHMTVGVVWEENGERQEAAVKVSYRNRWAPPQVGTKLAIGRNPLGTAIAYPDLSLRRLGLLLGVSAGIFLLIILLSDRAISQAEMEAIRSSASPEPKAPEHDPDLPEGVTRTEKGLLTWIGMWDQDSVREGGRAVIKYCGLIGLGVVLIGAVISGADGNWEFVLYILPVGLILLLIGIFCSHLMNKSPQSTRYELTEQGIRAGAGRGSQFFAWEDIREVRDCGAYLFISTAHRKTKIFAAREQIPFLLAIINQRISVKA